jgi:hypothetical protein
MYSARVVTAAFPLMSPLSSNLGLQCGRCLVYFFVKRMNQSCGSHGPDEPISSPTLVLRMLVAGGPLRCIRAGRGAQCCLSVAVRAGTQSAKEQA